MITSDLLTRIPLFAGLPESERVSIASRTADISLSAGEWAIQEGETAAFFAVVSGRLSARKQVRGKDVVLSTYLPGDFFGEVPLLLGSTALASVYADEPSRLIQLEDAHFHQLIASCKYLSAEVMRTMANRVAHVQEVEAATPVPVITVIGRRTDATCYDVRDFLTRAQLPVTWVDPDEPETGSGTPADSDRPAGSPTVVLPTGEKLLNPSMRVVAEKLGFQTVPQREVYDVAVIGAGPAGLGTAVYGASEGLRTIAIERIAAGGQAGTSSRIENYLGFPAGLSGDALSALASRQAKRLGAEILTARSVVAIEPAGDGGHHVITLDGGDRLSAATVVIATGVDWRRLDIPGFDAVVSRGVFYGAARTEALGTRGRDIYLVGGGNSAGQAAMLFSGYARSVTLVIRGPSLVDSMSRYLIDQLGTKSNIKVECDCEIVEVKGGESLEAIVIENKRTGVREIRQTQALFVFIGARAETTWLPAPMLRDERGYICTGRDILDLQNTVGGVWPLARDPYLLETNIPGIFAAGDVRHGSMKRVASSVGEGSMAIAFIHQYLAEDLPKAQAEGAGAVAAAK
jgi:thioredoxin reductase (NADPH)